MTARSSGNLAAFDALHLYIMNMLATKIHLGIYGICVQNGKVLMIKKGRGPYKGLLDLPGGKIEPGETFQQALYREFDEETGAKVLDYKPLCVSEYQCQWVNEGEQKAFHHVAIYNVVELDAVELKSDPDGHDSEGAKWVEIPMSATEVAPIAQEPLRKLGLLKE